MTQEKSKSKVDAYRTLSRGIYLMALEDDKLTRAEQARVLLDTLEDIVEFESADYIGLIDKLAGKIFGLKGQV